MWGFPGGANGKEPDCQYRRHKKHRLDPWVGKIPWRRAWQPTPVFLLESPLDQGVWQATVHGTSQSRTRLKWLSMHVHRLIFLILKDTLADLCRQSDSYDGSYYLLLKALNPGYFKMLHLLSKGALRISSWLLQGFKDKASFGLLLNRWNMYAVFATFCLSQ